MIEIGLVPVFYHPDIEVAAPSARGLRRRRAFDL